MSGTEGLALASPHGGTLVNLLVDGEQADACGAALAEEKRSAPRRTSLPTGTEPSPRGAPP